MNKTPIQNQLIQTICTLAPYGLQVQYYDGQIVTIDPTLREVTEKSIKERKTTIAHAISVVEQKMAKLVMHSTSKLTESVLEGGKVPIVELFKIAFPDNERYHLTEKGTILKKHLLGHLEFLYHFEKSSFISRHYNKEWHVIGYFNIPNQLELFNFMMAEGFNVFNLSEEYFTEKSTVKERGIKIIDKSKDFFKDLDRYDNQFYTNECDCEGKDNFAYDRTVANGEVWHCTKHNIEIMTDEHPREDNY